MLLLLLSWFGRIEFFNKKIQIVKQNDYKEIVNILTEALTQNILYDPRATEIYLSTELEKEKSSIGLLVIEKNRSFDQRLKFRSYQIII